ncbi:hypothetical protein [Pasteurella multocida]|uniref:hypothetical protein n=1 Tax=Pasteurella multocida TaxID=747 RepID=UPI0035A82B4D
MFWFKKLLKHLKSKSDLINEINELAGALDEKCKALVKLRADSQHRESELLREIEFKDSQIADFERIRQEKRRIHPAFKDKVRSNGT